MNIVKYDYIYFFPFSLYNDRQYLHFFLKMRNYVWETIIKSYKATKKDPSPKLILSLPCVLLLSKCDFQESKLWSHLFPFMVAFAQKVSEMSV